jgi:hypothetical protein
MTKVVPVSLVIFRAPFAELFNKILFDKSNFLSNFEEQFKFDK